MTTWSKKSRRNELNANEFRHRKKCFFAVLQCLVESERALTAEEVVVALKKDFGDTFSANDVDWTLKGLNSEACIMYNRCSEKWFSVEKGMRTMMEMKDREPNILRPTSSETQMAA